MKRKREKAKIQIKYIYKQYEKVIFAIVTL